MRRTSAPTCARGCRCARLRGPTGQGAQGRVEGRRAGGTCRGALELPLVPLARRPALPTLPSAACPRAPLAPWPLPLQAEQAEKEKRKKEKAEAHLYTLVGAAAGTGPLGSLRVVLAWLVAWLVAWLGARLPATLQQLPTAPADAPSPLPALPPAPACPQVRVSTDADFAAQVGSARHFDLVDHEQAGAGGRGGAGCWRDQGPSGRGGLAAWCVRGRRWPGARGRAGPPLRLPPTRRPSSTLAPPALHSARTNPPPLQVKTFKMPRKAPFGELRRRVAAELGVPLERQRFWRWAQRQNQTYRPAGLLRDDDDTLLSVSCWGGCRGAAPKEPAACCACARGASPALLP